MNVCYVIIAWHHSRKIKMLKKRPLQHSEGTTHSMHFPMKVSKAKDMYQVNSKQKQKIYDWSGKQICTATLGPFGLTGASRRRDEVPKALRNCLPLSYFGLHIDFWDEIFQMCKARDVVDLGLGDGTKACACLRQKHPITYKGHCGLELHTHLATPQKLPARGHD